MFSTPRKQEIDHRTIKLVVGIIALTLGSFTSVLTNGEIASISASYHEGGLPRDIFVGFLFAISAVMLAYNGESTREMILSRLAAVAAFIVAICPCKCGNHSELIPSAHYVAALVMFLVLARFCWIFHKRASAKPHREARVRSAIYLICMLVILASILVMGIDYVMKEAITKEVPRLVFYCERAGLVAFGFSWLTASRILPLITSHDERFAPWS